MRDDARLGRAKSSRPRDIKDLKGRAKRKAIRKEHGFFNYPRGHISGFRRWLPSWRVLLGTGIFVLLLGIGGLVWAYQSVEIPNPEQFATAQKTTVYYADGKSVMGEFASQDRVIVDGATLPEYVGQTFVAAEDRTFYQNQGISPPGMARALINNVTGGARQGGSTITQQYAERYYLGETKTYSGKFKEAILAVKLAQHQDKDEILSNYMNTIYLGRGTYGIESAAKRYFGISASDLTLEQAALIAGIVPNPTNWDPRVNPEKAESRWNYVLDGMVTLGWITQAQRDAAEFPETIEYQRSDTYRGTRGYLLEMVRSELINRGGLTDEEIDTRGLRVVTTIDKAMQSDMVDTVKAMPEDTPKNLRPALVSLDPDSGAIKALYGGKNYLKQQYNNVTQGAAQAGSTFKPFALLAAVEDGISVQNEYFNGNNSRTIDGFERPVVNFGNASYGNVNLMRATALSINTAYAQLNVDIGPERTMEAAISAGIPESTSGLNALPSNVLGTASVHPLDLANAYATIASGGTYRRAFIVDEASEVLSGDVVYKGKSKDKKAFDEDVTATVTNAMAGVVEWGSGKTATAIGRPAAGKTGTSSDNKSAWFAGFTPNLVTVVGLYQVGDDGSEVSIEPFGGYSEITGGTVPVDMWTSYMTEALADLPVVDLPEMPAEQKSAPTETEGGGLGDGDSEEDTQVAVPGGLVGTSADKAQSALEKAGLKAAIIEEYSDSVKAGVVISASAKSGSKLERGDTVRLVVSLGPKPKEPEPEDTPEPTKPGNGGSTTPPPTTGGGSGSTGGSGSGGDEGDPGGDSSNPGGSGTGESGATG
ncbi:hypothetical protein GCM10010401_10260 [Rarobacter faecitabidus]